MNKRVKLRSCILESYDFASLRSRGRPGQVFAENQALQRGRTHEDQAKRHERKDSRESIEKSWNMEVFSFLHGNEKKEKKKCSELCEMVPP